MKKLFVWLLAAALLFGLAGCGGLGLPNPDAPATDENAPPTTDAPETSVTEPLPPIEETPFSWRDVAEMQQDCWEVRDYAQRMPAQRYKYWYQGEGVYIYFYRQADEEAFLCLKTIGGVDGVAPGETAGLDALTERFLAAPAEIEFIRFASTGNAIQPPRGIQIGDPESKILECFPNHSQAGSDDVLYDVTLLYPWAKPEQGVTKYGSVIGGRKEMHGNWVFLSASYNGEDDTAVPLEWVNPLRLEYSIKDGKVSAIYFCRSYESN